MKVLVTNDDGVGSEGLHVLARALVDAGYDVVVAAPQGEMSGSSAAIGHIHLDSAIDAVPVELPLLDGVPCYAVAGPPGLCVLAARIGGFGDQPDLVISGINPGCNTGRTVLHSGTVGAALTGANFGVSGMAVSLDVSSRLLHEGAGRDGTGAGGPGGARTAGAGAEVAGVEVPAKPGEHVMAAIVGDAEGDGVAAPVRRDQPAQWAGAAQVAVSFAAWLVTAPPCTVLNVNVPNLAPERLAGVRVGQLAPFGTVRTGVVESAPGTNRLQLELRPTTEELPPGSDTSLVSQGFVSVTALQGIGADTATDLSGVVALTPGGSPG